MLAKPPGERAGLSVVQQVDRSVRFHIDEDGAVASAAPKGKIVNAKHARGGGITVLVGAKQAQQGVRADREPHRLGSSRTGLSAEGAGQMEERAHRALGAAGRSGQRRSEVLGEGATWTGWGETAKAPNDEMDAHDETAPRQIHGMTAILRVNIVAPDPTGRALSVRSRALGIQDHRGAIPADRIDQKGGR
jgi:hypothetical protein